MAEELPWDEILAESLTRIEEGKASPEECLARYPEHADALRPMLEIALALHRMPRETSSPAAYTSGLQKMLRAAAEEDRRQTTPAGRFTRFRGWLAALFQGRQRLAMGLTMSALTVLIVFAACSTVTLGGLFFFYGPNSRVAQTATLTQIDGVVEVLSAGSDAWQLASAGAQVAQGDRIRTGEDSAGSLVFFDGSMTTLLDKTEVTLVEMNSRRNNARTMIVLDQRIGQIHNQVQPLIDSASHFEIRTPSAVVTVKGTKFDTVVEPDGTTHVSVTEGVVNTTAEDVTVAVSAGEAATVRPGQAPGRVSTATPTPRPTLEPAAQPTETGEELTATPSLTSTPSPTPTPTPTATSTPKPTATATAIPTPIPTTPPPPPPTPVPTSPPPPPAPVPSPTWAQPPPPKP